MKSEVELHYKNLSEDYDKRINIYCQKRFIRIIRKYSRGKILEVGCGTGYAQSKIRGKPIGMDITLSMLKKNKNIAVCANAEYIPFKDNTFDILYSINMLEHVENPINVVKECKRVLKKNGIIILITPNGDMEFALDIAEKLKLKLPEGFHKFFKLKNLVKIFNKNKIKILSAEKFILFPAESGLISRFFEKLEKIFPYFCLFIIIIGSNDD